jgi:hypothetical protein
MVEQLPLAILAPWIVSAEQGSPEALVSIPRGIHDRLSQPLFTEDHDDRPRPHHLLHLIPTHSTEIGAELTDEQLVDREFGNANWHERVRREMEEKKLVQDKSAWTNEQPTIYGPRGTRDDLFSVRIDNLPEGFEPWQVEALLVENKCEYWARVVIPRDDDGNYKRFGFVKFERLRYALKFLEESQEMRAENMVLNVGLVN